jgi:hypothetical protein
MMRRDGLLPGDAIVGRRLDAGPGESYPSGTGGADNSALIAAIDGLTAKIASLGGSSGSVSPLPSCIPPNGQAVQFETVNLTDAQTNLEIKLTGCATYCRAWCDGSMEGITVKMRDQSAIPVDLSRCTGFPILSDTVKVFVTSDVRPGRSVLVLCFGAGESMSIIDHKAELQELAARLGSLVTYDRRGRVVWSDNFDGTQLKWIPTVTAGVGDVGLTNSYPYCGEQTCHIRTGAVLNDEASITRGMYLPMDKHLGFQSAFRLDSAWDDARLDFQMLLYNGTVLQLAALRVQSSGGVWVVQYYTSAGGWTTALATWSPRLAYTWHRIKFVVDFTNKLMVRGLVDDNVIDLSAVPTNQSADTTQALDLRIKLTTLGAAAREAWIDSAVLTDNETVDILH